MKSKVIKHAIVYGLGSQSVMLINFLMLPFITPYLSSEDYGIYGAITAYLASFSIIATLGLRVFINNIFFKSPTYYKWSWRQLLGFLNLWNIPYAIILGLVAYVAIPPEAKEHTLLLMFLNVIPYVFFGQTMMFGQAFYQLNQQPAQIAWRAFFSGTVTIFLNYLFIVYYKMGYLGWFWSGFIAAILNNLLYLPTLYKHKITPIFNFKWRHVKNALKISYPTIPSAYTSYLMTSANQVILDIHSTSVTDIGRYNVVNTISKFSSILNSAFDQATAPIVLNNLKQGNIREMKHVIFSNQIIYLCICGAMALWSKEVFFLLFRNPELRVDYVFGVIVIMSQVYRPMFLAVNLHLTYKELTKYTWRISFISGVINVVLVFAFIPIWGYKSVFFCTYIAFLYMGYIGHFLPKFRVLLSTNFNPLFWLFVQIIATISCFYLVEIEAYLKIILSTIFIIVAFYFFKRKQKTL